MIRKMRFLKIFFAITITIAIIVSGCSPALKTTTKSTSEPMEDTSTPFPADVPIPTFGPLCKLDLSNIRFPDGSELYLAPETEIEILTIADPSTETSGIEILLRRGQLVIVSKLPLDTWFTVVNSGGDKARLAGLIMYVSYDIEIGNFDVICVDGNCEFESAVQAIFQLSSEFEGWLDENGNFQGPFEIDINTLREGCGEDYISVVIPPTPTPDIGATATAFCGDFEEENPGTPCP